VLIHVVESPTARLHGKESADFETKADKERLESYVQQLNEKGYNATAHLGFRDRAKKSSASFMKQKPTCW
jgi:hypothetical protein